MRFALPSLFQFLKHNVGGVVVLLLLGLVLFPSLLMAQEGGVDVGETGQTNPKIRQPVLTATVADNEPPTVPILIAPGNNTYVTISKPALVWEAATDANGIGHYQLYIDGVLHFNFIPIVDTDNADYTLTYDSMTSRYTLTPKVGFSEGSHTWKIRAEDTLNNGTDSATWTFIIDTQAPSFVVTAIGDATVSISAQDSSTIPTQPVELEENEPLVTATGEANSTVQVTLTIPGDPTQNFTVAIDGSGNWSLQLGILPRDVVMTLDFIITDPAGNISVLSGVEFIILQDEIVFPPESPSPSDEPEPSEEPEVEEPLPSPVISVPLIPPREIIHEVGQEITEVLPPSVQVLLSNLPETILKRIEDVAPVSSLLVSSIIPIASSIAVASQFGGSISPQILMRILQALGLIPVGKPQGMVFNSDNSEGVPFALLTISSANPQAELQIRETAVTDVNGIYRGLSLPSGEYKIEVSHQDFIFPTNKKRPQHLSIYDFYRGEVVKLDDTQSTLFLIPVDPREKSSGSTWKYRLRLFLARLSRYSTWLLWISFVVSLILATLYPSIWNWLVVSIYTVLIVLRSLKWFKTPLITGTAIDGQGNPMPNVIIRLFNVANNDLVLVSLTNDKGEFSYSGPRDKYQLAVQKQGFIWVENGSPLSLYEVDASLTPQHVIMTLTPLSQIYEDMFKPS